MSTTPIAVQHWHEKNRHRQSPLFGYIHTLEIEDIHRWEHDLARLEDKDDATDGGPISTIFYNSKRFVSESMECAAMQ